MNSLRTYLVLAVFVGSSAPAFANLFGQGPVENAEVFNQLTVNFGAKAPIAPLPSTDLRVYIWNIHKAADHNLPQDFRATASGSDLVLFQEAVNYPEFTAALTSANPTLSWTMAKSFSVSGDTYTGVATGSRVQPLKEEVIVSEPTEPVTHTHKTILISQFAVAGQPLPLLVANIHAINFVTTKTFEIQINQLLARISQHRGPMLVGGDFNTWNSNRLEYLQTVFAPLGLKFIETKSDHFFNLDHVFVRGLTPRSVGKLSQIHSSDHTPLTIDLNFDIPQLESHENIL